MRYNWSKEACDDFVLSVYEDFSVDSVAELLLPSGLLIDKTVQYAGTFEKYVFLKGNKDEVYTRQERDFISATGDIIVFLEFHKTVKRGLIPCRVVAVRNRNFDTLPFCIAFTKILNKASNGFNICVIVSEDGIVFTCRAYDNHASNTYYISDLIRTEEQKEELYDNLIFSSDYTGFIEYYSFIRDAIHYRMNSAGYFPKARNIQNNFYSYSDELQDVANAAGLDYSWKKRRHFLESEEEKKVTFSDQVSEADKYLFKVESSQINTMEMLFEAEEMEKLASEAEKRNKEMLVQKASENEDKPTGIDAETKALLDDPEAMIKLLKKKRGI